MNSCIIVQRPFHFFVAFNEDGRRLVSAKSYREAMLWVARNGYVEVSLNSRLGRTILDKVEGQTI